MVQLSGARTLRQGWHQGWRGVQGIDTRHYCALIPAAEAIVRPQGANRLLMGHCVTGHCATGHSYTQHDSFGERHASYDHNTTQGQSVVTLSGSTTDSHLALRVVPCEAPTDSAGETRDIGCDT